MRVNDPHYAWYKQERPLQSFYSHQHHWQIHQLDDDPWLSGVLLSFLQILQVLQSNKSYKHWKIHQLDDDPSCQESYCHSYKSYKSFNLKNLTNIGRFIRWMMTQVVRSLTVILSNLTSLTI